MQQPIKQGTRRSIHSAVNQSVNGEEQDEIKVVNAGGGGKWNLAWERGMVLRELAHWPCVARLHGLARVLCACYNPERKAPKKLQPSLY